MNKCNREEHRNAILFPRESLVIWENRIDLKIPVRLVDLHTATSDFLYFTNCLFNYRLFNKYNGEFDSKVLTQQL